MFQFGNVKDRVETERSYHHGFDTAGRIAVVFAFLILLRFLFGILGVPYSPIVALVCTALLVVFWIVMRVRAQRRKLKKASELRAQASKLEEQEFLLRYEEAKLSGQLDRWEKDK